MRAGPSGACRRWQRSPRSPLAAGVLGGEGDRLATRDQHASLLEGSQVPRAHADLHPMLRGANGGGPTRGSGGGPQRVRVDGDGHSASRLRADVTPEALYPTGFGKFLPPEARHGSVPPQAAAVRRMARPARPRTSSLCEARGDRIHGTSGGPAGPPKRPPGSHRVRLVDALLGVPHQRRRLPAKGVISSLRRVRPADREGIGPVLCSPRCRWAVHSRHPLSR